MLIAFKSLSLICALFHLGFLVLEMFLWTTPTGLKIFRMSEAQAQLSKVLAMNQGLYNGLLAAGLLYGLATGDLKVMVIFLIMMAVAGIYGAVTASPNIFFVQALPALLALILRMFL